MAQRAKSGDVVFMEGGSQPPFRQLGDLGERCKLPSAAQSRAPLAKRFCLYLNASDAFPATVSWLTCK